MKAHIFVLVVLLGINPVSYLFSSELLAQSNPVKVVVTDLLIDGNPSSVRIENYLGEKINACIHKRVMEQDISHLIAPFYHKTESYRWQSEFLGKWLLGAVLSYRYNQNPILLDSIQKGVAGLVESQSPDGYIGNYSPDAQLQQWDIWGRKYSMLGLLSYYDLTKDKKVLATCKKAADHLMTQVGPDKTDIVSTGNYYGMASSSVLEPIVFLYCRTGDTRYLEFAKYIVGQWETAAGPNLISKALKGIPVGDRFPHPTLVNETWFGAKNGQKAYEMMSCYEGLLEIYKLTNDPLYLNAVEKTVKNIMETEINIAGSGSAFECWYHGKTRQTVPTYHTMETCVTMTWMKLCQALLRLTGNPRYADQMEITAYNSLLASMKEDASQIAKYSPLEGQRHSGEEQCGMHINCCNANGPRAFALLPQFALMQSSDKKDIFINLYTDLKAEVILASNKKVSIVQETNYPQDGEIRLKIDPAKAETFSIALRIPSWSKKNSIKIGEEEMENIVPETYYKITRVWKKGDVITLNLDVRGRLIHQDNHVAVVKGPVALARDSRFNDGFIDQTAQIVTHEDIYVDLNPVAEKKDWNWMSYAIPLILGTDLEGEGKEPKQVYFCDFASAGNTWSPNVRYRVWIPETLNVMNKAYVPYNK
ncbi:beta-L-arabinofuranosidase domain-containing protein [Bacteroides sp.]|uniref:beta-L-arabinofuranosidase domain-containing protein n=1 Tax=Bacteroides sp. TaxID=29523 RepID=UPI002628A418|nr:beta-L-arabinofuranosidase domain-containing protein [Bacteroides sp.]MDD3040693.1 glycoside hydrolase family 127 protein [Bacteroides sp.]